MPQIFLPNSPYSRKYILINLTPYQFMNKFEGMQNLNMTFSKFDFILAFAIAFRTEFFNCDLCIVWYAVSRILKDQRKFCVCVFLGYYQQEMLSTVRNFVCALS